MQSYFVWNDIDCRSMGVITNGAAPIVRPEERVEHVTIPGRSGDLTVLQGEQVYNSYIQTVGIIVHGGDRVREVFKWLRGSGTVTFSGEPDRKQAARIIGAVTLNKYSRNLDYWVGEVQFYCQPYKQLLHEAAVTVTESGAAVKNNGDVVSFPRITVTAGAETVIITANGNTLTLTGCESGQTYIVDSDTLEVLDGAGTALLTQNSSGDFPTLAPGANAVTGSGWTSLTIERRERYL